MPIDTSIYGQIQPAKFESPLNALAQVMQVQQAQSQNKLADLTLAQHQRGMEADNALASLLATPGANTQNVVQGLAAKGYGNAALSYQKQQAEADKTKAETDKNKATAQKTTLEAANIALTQHRALLNGVNDPQSGAQWLISAYQNPDTKAIFERFGPLDEALKRYQQAVSIPGGFEKWKMGASMNADELVKYTTPDANAKLSADTSRANNAATNAVTMRGQNMTDARAREQIAQGKTQVIQTENGPVVADLRTGTGRPLTVNGQPVPSKETQQRTTDAKSVLNLLDMAEPLIDKSTQGLVGTGVDMAAAAVGKSLPGAQAAAQLKALEGALISKMPKMSGPQSDKDVLLYRQMAGQIGDSMVPADTRKAAIRTIRELNQKYLGSTGPTSTPAGVPDDIAALLQKHGGK